MDSHGFVEDGSGDVFVLQGADPAGFFFAVLAGLMVLWRVVLEAFPSPARIRCSTVLQIGSPDARSRLVYTYEYRGTSFLNIEKHQL